MIFPTVCGENLLGREFTIPYGLEGEFNLAMVAFEPTQHFLLQTWLPLLSQLSMQYDRFRYYELPTLGNLNDDQRTFFSQGMRRNIPDPAMREIVITLYLDKAAFCEALQVRGENTIYLFLIDREGEVLWRAEGIATQNKKDDLTKTLKQIYDSPIDLWWEV